jgi:hypothetical protein
MHNWQLLRKGSAPYVSKYAFYLHAPSWAINQIGFLQYFIALCKDVLIVSVCVDLFSPITNMQDARSSETCLWNSQAQLRNHWSPFVAVISITARLRHTKPHLPSIFPPIINISLTFVQKLGSILMARATFVSGPRHRRLTAPAKGHNMWTVLDHIWQTITGKRTQSVHFVWWRTRIVESVRGSMRIVLNDIVESLAGQNRRGRTSRDIWPTPNSYSKI